MKLKPSIALLLIPAVVLNACNNGSGSSPAQSSNGATSYALGTSGQLYLNHGSDIWSQVELAALPAGTTYGMNCGLSTCAMASDSGISVSNDMQNWIPVMNGNSLMTAALYSVIVTDYASGQNTIVAVGQGGNIVTSSTTNKAASATGSKPQLTATTNTAATQNNLFQVVYHYAGGVYLAIGANGTIIQSTDANTWNSENSPVTNSLFAIDCGIFTKDNACTVVGEKGTILKSSDGTNWDTVTSPTNKNLYAVASNALYANKITYVATGDNTVLYSTDRTNWTQANIPATIQDQSYSLYNVVYNGNKFVANIALADGTYPNAYLTSPDGSNWSATIPQPVATNQQLMADTDNNGVGALVVGATGLIAAGSTVLTDTIGGVATTAGPVALNTAVQAARSAVNEIMTQLIDAGVVVDDGSELAAGALAEQQAAYHAADTLLNAINSQEVANVMNAGGPVGTEDLTAAFDAISGGFAEAGPAAAGVGIDIAAETTMAEGAAAAVGLGTAGVGAVVLVAGAAVLGSAAIGIAALVDPKFRSSLSSTFSDIGSKIKNFFSL